MTGDAQAEAHRRELEAAHEQADVAYGAAKRQVGQAVMAVPRREDGTADPLRLTEAMLSPIRLAIEALRQASQCAGETALALHGNYKPPYYVTDVHLAAFLVWKLGREVASMLVGGGCLPVKPGQDYQERLARDFGVSA